MGNPAKKPKIRSSFTDFDPPAVLSVMESPAFLGSGILYSYVFVLSTGLLHHLAGKRFRILKVVYIRPPLVQPAEIF
jgi:hypothetical protein